MSTAPTPVTNVVGRNTASNTTLAIGMPATGLADGQLLVLNMATGSNATVSSITGGAGGTWTQLQTLTNSTTLVAYTYWRLCTASTDTSATITVTFSGAGLSAGIIEVWPAGCTIGAEKSQQTNADSTTETFPALTPLNSNYTGVGAVFLRVTASGSTAPTSTPGSGWTEMGDRGTAVATSNEIGVEDKYKTFVGSYNTAFTPVSGTASLSSTQVAFTFYVGPVPDAGAAAIAGAGAVSATAAGVSFGAASLVGAGATAAYAGSIWCVGTSNNFANGVTPGHPMSVTLPTGIVANDLIEIVIYSRAASGSLQNIPAGYSTRYSSSSANYGIFKLYKIADGSESGASVSLDLTIAIWQIHARVFRGVDTSTTYDATQVANSGNSTSITNSGVTSVTDGAIFTVDVMQQKGNTVETTLTDPGGIWSRLDHTFATSTTAGNTALTYINPAGLIPAGASGSVTVTTGNIQQWGVVVDALKPITAAVTINGAAALTGAGATSATGASITLGTSSLAGAGALSATGVSAVMGVAALSGAGALTATPKVITPGSAGLVGAGSTNATSTVVIPATASVAGASTLTATGRLSFAGVSSISGVGVISAVPTVVIPGTAVFSGAGALTAAANQRVVYFSYWDGTTEYSLTLQGEWNGTTVVPLTYDGVAP
jgi:hypothetical protein